MGSWGLGGSSAGCPTSLVVPFPRRKVATGARDRWSSAQPIGSVWVLIATEGDYGENGTLYRTERETFARIRSVGISPNVDGQYSGPNGFILQAKNGLEYHYGLTNDSSVFVQPRFRGLKRAWALNEIRSPGAQPERDGTRA